VGYQLRQRRQSVNLDNAARETLGSRQANEMKKTLWIASLAVLVCVGCNVGNAPQPMDEAQLKSAVEKMPPQDQINYINASPMPKEMKEQRIAEIKAKAGMK
jgi:hypothetical protein